MKLLEEKTDCVVEYVLWAWV